MRRTLACSTLLLAMAVASASADVAPRARPAHRHVLRADPANKFTYVAPPPAIRARGLAQVTTATFVVTYIGFESYPLAQAAFQRAVDIWATQIATTVPIAMEASFTPMSEPGILGTGGPTYVWDIGMTPQSWYPIPLANQLTGVDLIPGEPDIRANFNSNFPSWHFGTDPAPAGKYDFTTVVLHEIGHGLGFLGSADSDSINGYLWEPPIIYDRFVANGFGSAITSFPSGTPQLHTQLTGGNLFWVGPSGGAGNGGSWPKIYAPSFWNGGSSYSHLDETVFPAGHANSLMTPMLGAAETILDPGPGTRGILRDLGWTVAGAGQPALTASRNALTFGAIRTPFTPTSAQTIAVTQSSGTPAAWTASANVPWIQVSPGSGAGSGTLTIGVVNSAILPSSGAVTGQVTLTSGAAWNTPVTITVRLNLLRSGSAASPYGYFETPINGTANVTGSIAVTGWALDDVEVTRVRIYRASVSPEPPNTFVYIGDADFVDGARPDVEASAPNVPLNYRAGWGYLLLTNMLPNQGNGPYTLYAYADDREAHTRLLGTKTITCTNASAIKPFGAIDTPGQGGTASGSAYVNFGWALTPQPGSIPIDGSTITVYIDGVPVGNVAYGNHRQDIATLFPGYENSDGAVGYRYIDTTALTNGVHTIAWGLVDDIGRVEGIGSRYFTVQNDATPSISSNATQLTAARDATWAVSAAAGVLARTGFSPDESWKELSPDANGARRTRIEELGRLELTFPAAGRRCRPAEGALPIGAQFNRSSGTFTWAPGPGFLGDYALPFVCTSSTGAVERVPLTVSIVPRRPRGPRAAAPRVVIDTPRRDDRIDGAFRVAGWALDEAAQQGTGIVTLHVWAYPVTRSGYGQPVFLGVAAYGGERPDVGRIYGERFAPTGFSLSAGHLAAGVYDLAVFPFSSVSGTFGAASTVRVNVR